VMTTSPAAIVATARAGDVVITMGAGSIGGVAKLVAQRHQTQGAVA
jgi:UDP-N-acetylmuramate-alanine ligase